MTVELHEITGTEFLELISIPEYVSITDQRWLDAVNEIMQLHYPGKYTVQINDDQHLYMEFSSSFHQTKWIIENTK